MFSFIFLPLLNTQASVLDTVDRTSREITKPINKATSKINRTARDASRTANNVSRTAKNVKNAVSDVAGLFGIKFGSGGSAGLPDGEFELPSDSEYNMVHTTSLRDFIQNVLNFLITFVGIIGIGAIIYAGYLYVMAGGDDGNIDKAKKIIIYVAIGILVISASYAIVNTVINETVTGGDDRGGSHSNFSNADFGKVLTNFAPGTTLPAGTVVGDGVRLLRDTVVDNDGTVSVAGDLIQDTDTLNLVNLLSFQNGITVTGNGVTDLGTAVVVSKEAASNVNFGLTTEATAIFDFGDGTQGLLDTISNPNATLSHGFGDGQTYQIKAKAQTADGAIHSFDKNLIVGGTDAAFSLSKDRLLVGENVVMDGNQSHVSIGSIQSYNWSCSGGTGCFGNIQGPSITASFGTAGTYEITLTINNAIGTNDSMSKTVTVLNNQPIASFVFQNANNATLPSEFRFDANTSQNIEGSSDNLTYEWTFDGNVIQKTTPITTYRFTSDGNKTVSLKVIQQVNGQRLSSESITQTVDVQTTISPNFNISQ